MLLRPAPLPEIAEIKRRLEPRGPKALEDKNIVWYSGIPSLEEPFRDKNVYKLTESLKGTKRRLGKGTFVLCMIGSSGPVAIPGASSGGDRFKVGRLFFNIYGENIYYPYTDEEGTPAPLATVAAEGIQRYLGGYSRRESNEVEERVNQNLASWQPIPENQELWRRALRAASPGVVA